MITNTLDISEQIENVEKIIVGNALSKISLADEGLVIDIDICKTSIENMLYFCLMRFSMFNDAQKDEINNIYKQMLLL